MIRGARFALAILLLLLAAAGGAQARVFWTLGGRDSGGLVDPGEAGWQRAYTTSLRLNDGRAEVSVWAADRDIDGAFAELKRRIEAQGGHAFFAAAGDLGWGFAADDARVWRFVATALDGRACRVFQVTQSPEDYRASLQPPSAHPLREVPEVPGGQPTQFIANEGTGVSLASARAAGTPADVLRRYADTLSGAGWRPVLPATGQTGVYARGREVLVVSAVSSGPGADCLITLLLKQRRPGREP